VSGQVQVGQNPFLDRPQVPDQLDHPGHRTLDVRVEVRHHGKPTLDVPVDVIRSGGHRTSLPQRRNIHC
jgi:hypothetical protein